MTCLKVQVRVIAAFETIISSCLLALNFKILVEQVCKKDEVSKEELGEIKNVSASARILFFLIRVIYLVGEFLLAIFLNIWVYRENANGLIMWFTVTILFSIASRCYFIGGIIWENFFVITLVTFLANLAFTIYSLIVVFLFVKQLTNYQEDEHVTNYFEML